MAGKSFSLQVAEFIAKAKENADSTVRETLFEMDKKIVERSPVGDTKKWLSLRPYSTWKRGKKSGKVKTMLKGPAGYVGGRFRSNWQLSVDVPAAGVLSLAAPDVAAAIAAHGAVLKGAKAGHIYYLVNNLPYAIPLENGHSKQAPIGMVGITVMEFQSIVNEVVAGIKK